MKKIVLLGLLFIGLNGFAQGTGVWVGSGVVKDGPSTNEKEYNYLTKGLKIQKESGLDVIAGYEFQNEERVIIDNKYLFTFSDFVEKATNKIKGVSVIIRSGVTQQIYYACIPVNEPGYMIKYNNFIDSFTPELSKDYIKALSQRYLALSLKK